MNITKVDKKICSGCGACFNLCPFDAITMQENEEGFLFPSVDENKCTNCGLCYKKCPVVVPKYDNNSSPICYAAMGGDTLRLKSSSGGVFSILAEYVLRNNGYVVGAAYADNYKKVKHIMISQLEDLPKLRTSKYIQSDTGKIYCEIKEKLSAGALVLFSGCPCQVAGLKSYLGKNYDNLVLVDIVCHGVPSYKVFEKFTKDLDVNSEISNVNFREKKQYGWTPTMLIEYANGTEYYQPKWKCNYYDAFLSIMACRKSCGDCRFNKLPRQGDITLADFWGIGEKYPELDDKKGTSLVLLNNKHGEDVFNTIKANIPVVKEVDIEIARKQNGNVFGSSKEHWERDRFMKLLNKYSFTSSLKRIKGRWFDVGIIGWWYGKNYGSALTYFALHEVVEGLRYDTLMLEWPWRSKPFPKISNNFVREFARKHYNMSAQYTFEEYPSLNNHINQFLVGSDQLWNWWDSKDMGNYYMLDFVDERRKKISYATSFGHPDYPAPQEVITKQSQILKTFDAISVREDDGVKICKNVFGVNAVQTWDPVFLCDIQKYEELVDEAEIVYDKPYMLAYILSPNEEKGRILKQTAASLGLELIIILDGQTDIEKNKQLLGVNAVRSNVNIEQWLAYIYHSSFVITDSFHGVCFSIIFKKQFTCILNKARGISRFNTLLGKLDLMPYAVNSPEELQTRDLSGQKIDYAKTYSLLEPEVKRSLQWLKDALAKPHIV